MKSRASFCFLMCTSLTTYILSDTAICDGEWVHDARGNTYGGLWDGREWHIADKWNSALEGGRGSYNDSSTWFNSACATQMTHQSCFWTGDTSRAKSLTERVFKPFNEKGCRNFYPFDFLKLLKGRTLLFLGDSVSFQIVNSLVCAVYKHAQSKLFLRFTYPSLYQKAEICPFGSLHCLLHETYCHFENEDIRITHQMMLKFGAADNLYAPIKHHFLTNDDIVVVNFGIHYNDEVSYKEDLELFREVILSNFSDKGCSKPHILFMQTSPQHFRSSNGYFESPEKSTFECVPIPSNFSDWRNECLDSILSEDVRIIRIAQGLYSEYDTHVGSFQFMPSQYADCTHFCYPSAIFSYIHRVIYNTILQIFDDRIIVNLGRYVDGTLLQACGSPSIYVIENGTRRQFLSIQTFAKLGFDTDNVMVITSFEMEEIKLGDPMI